MGILETFMVLNTSENETIFVQGAKIWNLGHIFFFYFVVKIEKTCDYRF